jgi:FkbH-like protein
MAADCYSALLVSDFNTSNFSGYLRNDREWPKIEPISAPYGQVHQALLNFDYDSVDVVIVWTRPEAVIPSFSRLLDGEPQSVDKLLLEADAYVELLLRLRDKVRLTFVPTWVIPHQRRAFATTGMTSGIGMDQALMRLNIHLAESLEQVPGFYTLNAQHWVGNAGKAAFSSKLWYMSKTPYGNEVFKEAVTTIKSAIRGANGRSKKLIVLDLDGVLWGGIVGEDGWQNLKIGGHDPRGEAFLDFQKALKALSNRGIVLGIVSKNDEPVALEAIRCHPEMALRIDDFVGWRINWSDKAQNVADLVSSLNLGLEAAVFIDDNPVERARVRETLPQVVVPDWPADITQYKDALLGLPYFDAPALTKEDQRRTQMYVSERERASSKTTVGSIDEWLNTLATVVARDLLSDSNLARATQLLNKTNQMNLATRRMTDMEFLEWSNQGKRRVWVFRVIDKFGDLGLTGIISLDPQGSKATIVDFVLSCRIMGRRIEETMLSTTIEYARTLGLKEVWAFYEPTSKNGPCFEFWKRSGFKQDGHSFMWDAKADYPVPEQVRLEDAS